MRSTPTQEGTFLRRAMIVLGLLFLGMLHGCEQQPSQSVHGPRSQCSSRPGSSTQPAGQVVFDTLLIDLGERYASSAPLLAKFPFQNTGTSPATLMIAACCGSQVSFPGGKSTYQPGESGEILLEFFPRYHEVQAKRTATVEQIGVEVPIAQLEVVATIKRHWQAEPFRIAFGRVLPGQVAEAEVVVEPGSDEERGEILGFSVDSPLLDVAQVATTQPQVEPMTRTWKYAVRLTGDDMAGRFESDIVFKTSMPAQPEVVVPVSADFPGRVELVPPRLYFGLVAPGTTVGKRLSVQIHDEQFAGEITVDAGQNNMTLKDKKRDDTGRRFDLYFELTVPMDAKEILQGQIQITCQGLSECAVSWTAFVRSATEAK